jgi:acetylornithine/N-succinyldiaminopimelate aminotransferase
LLVFDEIQCGMGRTGKLFAYQWEEDVTPDLLTIAKALGCGLPIGALLATEAVASAFQAGDHGTTFGGNPITASVANVAFRRLRDPELHVHVLRQGEAIRNWLEELNLELGIFREVRGRGLMLAGVLREELAGKAGELMEAARQAGVLILIAGPDVLRFVPPLTLSDEELQTGFDRLGPALREWSRSAIS